jgi:hypothetical protein
MNELVTLVAQKTGLSQENAQKAVQTVVDFIKAKLPAPIASQVDAVLSGDFSGSGAQAGEMLKGKLGGMFGGEKTS